MHKRYYALVRAVVGTLSGKKNVALLSASALAIAAVTPAIAFDFEYGEITGTFKTRISLGAQVRTEDQDLALLGKLNIEGQEALCDTGGDGGIQLGGLPADQLAAAGVTDPLGGCALSSFARFIAAEGSYSAHGIDDGNLNYDKHDVVQAAVKMVNDFSASYGDYRVVGRVISIADPVTAGFEEFHQNSFFDCDGNGDGTVTQQERDDARAANEACGAQPINTPREKDAEDAHGFDVNLETFYFEALTEYFDRTQVYRIGKQTIRWGESLALPINSINTINPPDAVRLRTPGRTLDEIFNPTNAFLFTTDLTDSVSMQATYLLGWDPVRINSPGTFFSPADIIGVGQGREAATLGLGFSREDPGNLLDRPMGDNVNIGQFGRDCFADPEGDGFVFTDIDGNNFDRPGFDGENGTLNQGAHRGLMRRSTVEVSNGDGTTRTVDGLRPDTATMQNGAAEGLLDFTGGRQACLSNSRTPDNNGQWGIQFKWFAENLGGSEIGFYYLNYHSRLPYISLYSAQLPDDNVPVVPDAVPLSGALNLVSSVASALKVADTLRLVVDYPEDIDMFGISISTNVGDYSVSAEYSYRPDLPLQVNVPDLIFYGQAPAFQTARCNSIPSIIDQYRNGDYREFTTNIDDTGANGCPSLTSNAPGEFIEGYERFPVGQGEVVVISLAETNPFKANSWIRILDVGFTKVFGMPNDPQLLALNGAATQTTPLPGRASFDPDGDGARNNPDDTNGDGRVDGNDVAAADDPTRADDNLATAVILNPVQEDNRRFGTPFSWGYRFIHILTYEQILSGTMQFTFAFFHDVNGNTPGPGTNFIEDRKSIVWGTQFEKGSWKVNGTMSWNTGAGRFNAVRDRDNFELSATYTF